MEEITNRSTKFGQNQANFFWKYFYEKVVDILDQKYSFKTKMGIIFISIVRPSVNKTFKSRFVLSDWTSNKLLFIFVSGLWDQKFFCLVTSILQYFFCKRFLKK